MKANQILTALQVVKPSMSEKSHAKTLSEIYAMVKELAPKVERVEVLPLEFSFGSVTEILRYGRSNKTKGKIMAGERWIMYTSNGVYSVSLPTGNDFYHAFCDLLPMFAPKNQRAEVSADKEILLNEVITKEVKKAMTFIKYDELQTSKNNVHLVFASGKCEVMGTDGYKVYQSELIHSFEDDFILLLPVNELKQALAGKAKELKVNLFLQDGQFNNGTVNGVRFEYCTDKHINYKNVVPVYESFIEVNRVDLLQAVKRTLITANKVTHMVKLHFNGSVELSTNDEHFGHDSSTKVSYQLKTTPDFDISFNGKFLADCLSVLDEKMVKIYSAGANNKAVLLDSRVVLMPMMNTNL